MKKIQKSLLLLPFFVVCLFALVKDVRAAGIPTDFDVLSVAKDQINMSWNAPQDKTGLAGYKVYRDGNLVKTLGADSTSYQDTGLSPERVYSYSVASYDTAGKISSRTTELKDRTFHNKYNVRQQVFTPQKIGIPIGGLTDYGFYLENSWSNNSSKCEKNATDYTVNYGRGYKIRTYEISPSGCVYNYSWNIYNVWGSGNDIIRIYDPSLSTKFKADDAVKTIGETPIYTLPNKNSLIKGKIQKDKVGYIYVKKAYQYKDSNVGPLVTTVDNNYDVVPYSVNGITWWCVNFGGYGSGWVKEDDIVRVTTTIKFNAWLSDYVGERIATSTEGFMLDNSFAKDGLFYVDKHVLKLPKKEGYRASLVTTGTGAVIAGPLYTGSGIEQVDVYNDIQYATTTVNVLYYKVNSKEMNASVPTASITINGSHDFTYVDGQDFPKFRYVWSSTNANIYSSSYIPNNNKLCGGSYDNGWIAGTSNGDENWSSYLGYLKVGCVFTITYTAKNIETGKSATDTVVLRVVADTTPPSKPTSLTTTIISQSSLRLGWISPADDISHIRYEIHRDSTKDSKVITNQSLIVCKYVNSSRVCTLYQEDDLDPNMEYKYTVYAFDEAGNMSSSSPLSIKISDVNLNDKTPPTQPTSLKALTPGTSQISLFWNASTDNNNIGWVGYKVYRGSTNIATVKDRTSYLDTGLDFNTTYTYTVYAFDQAGNISPASTPLSIKIADKIQDGNITATTTTSTPDPTASITADGLHEKTYVIGNTPYTYAWSSTNADTYSSSFTSNNANLCGSSNSWIANTANGSYTRPSIPTSLIGCIYNITYTVKNSKTGKTATSNAVVKIVAAAPVPTPIKPVSTPAVTTTKDTTPPTQPTSLTATTISQSQINLKWNASTDNVGVTGYKIYRGGTNISTINQTSYSDTGLNPNTTYTYTVYATDREGNTSVVSTSASAKTLEVPTTNTTNTNTSTTNNTTTNTQTNTSTTNTSTTNTSTNTNTGTNTTVTVPDPTALITADDSHNKTYTTGNNPYTYKWSSTNADTFTSSVTSNNNTQCGYAQYWIAYTANGSYTESSVPANLAGCVYTIKYTATNSKTGKSSTDTLIVNIVAPTTTNTNTNDGTTNCTGIGCKSINYLPPGKSLFASVLQSLYNLLGL